MIFKNYGQSFWLSVFLRKKATAVIGHSGGFSHIHLNKSQNQQMNGIESIVRIL